MPYYRKNTRRKPYRKYRKRRMKQYVRLKSNYPITSIKTSNPLPSKVKLHHRWTDYLAVNLTDGQTAVDYLYICANGLYKPNYGAAEGITHAPSGFQKIMSMFDHYTVIYADVKVTFVNPMPDHPVVVGLDAADSVQGLTTDWKEILESGTCKYTTLSPKGSGRDTGTIRYRLNIGKFLGISKIMSSANCRGLIDEYPSERCYINPFVYAPSVVGNYRMGMHINIDFQTVFTEPKAVGIEPYT